MMRNNPCEKSIDKQNSKSKAHKKDDSSRKTDEKYIQDKKFYKSCTKKEKSMILSTF